MPWGSGGGHQSFLISEWVHTWNFCPQLCNSSLSGQRATVAASPFFSSLLALVPIKITMAMSICINFLFMFFLLLSLSHLHFAGDVILSLLHVCKIILKIFLTGRKKIGQRAGGQKKTKEFFICLFHLNTLYNKKKNSLSSNKSCRKSTNTILASTIIIVDTILICTIYLENCRSWIKISIVIINTIPPCWHITKCYFCSRT